MKNTKDKIVKFPKKILHTFGAICPKCKELIMEVEYSEDAFFNFYGFHADCGQDIRIKKESNSIIIKATIINETGAGETETED